MEVEWHFKKSKVMEEPWILASDISHISPAKQYTALETYKKYVRFLEANKFKYLNEIIKSIKDTTFMYFDIDMPQHGDEDITDSVVDLFLETLSNVLDLYYHLHVKWTIGNNCQVATASSNTKCSIHFIGYIVVPTVEYHKALAMNVVAYVIEKDIKGLMFNYKGKIKCAVDYSVYTNFRCYRCLYMTKCGQNRPLLPYKNSSIYIKHHLVNYYETISVPPIAILEKLDLCLPKRDFEKTETPKYLVTLEKPAIRELRGEETDSVMGAFTHLRHNKQLLELLKVDDFRIKNVYSNGTGYYSVCIKALKGCDPLVCPYAKRAHKHNNIYVRYSKITNRMSLYCFDDDCKDVKKYHITSYMTNSLIQEISETANLATLHTHEDTITWTHKYTCSTMNDYPKSEMVCVRAGMGTGKTVAMKRFIKKHFSYNTKGLVVTFGRTLSKKYHEDLQTEGFKNYLDCENPVIMDNKVIVCLDSLRRIGMRNPDYLFIDEALSVFLHFNSPLMFGTNEIAILLELLILQAKTVFFLDACIDNAFMVKVVKYFTDMKRVTPVWIYNTYIRETNRLVELYTHVGDESFKASPKCKNILAYSAIVHICSLVKEKKKVVVCSSTKGFTTLLGHTLEVLFPELKIGIYNSDTTKIILQQSEDVINTRKWNTYDVLIYSPSITAGVSFEELHFDVLVGYLVNSIFTPSVDITLQQLFRVRRLKEGNMYLYVYNQAKEVRVPVTDEEIEQVLSIDNHLVEKHYDIGNSIHFSSQQKIEDDRLVYDKDRLSYQILKGITMLTNRSLKYYTETLINTLKKDYNIPVVEMSTDERSVLDEQFIIEADETTTTDLPEFEDRFIIDNDDYCRIQTLEQRTPLQDIQCRLYVIAHIIWRIKEGMVDKEFYDEFVKPKNAFEIAYTAQRCLLVGNNTYMEMCIKYKEKVDQARRFEDSITKDDQKYVKKDINLYMYSNRKRGYYEKLFSGIRLLNTLTSEMEWKSKLKDFGSITLTEEELESKFTQYMDGFSEREKQDLKKIFRLESTSAFIVCGNILKNAFGFKISRGGTNKKKSSYKILYIQMDRFKEAFEKYKPRFIINTDNNYVVNFT
jgi:hypothetical protein